MQRMCQQFYCDRRGDRYCCADCPTPCNHKCLNHPSRCRLELVPGAVKPRSAAQERPHILTDQEKVRLRELLKTPELSNLQIAQAMAMSVSSVARYRGLWGIPRRGGRHG